MCKLYTVVSFSFCFMFLFMFVNTVVFGCVELISVNTKYPMSQQKQNSRFLHYSERETYSAKIREK